MKKHLALFGFLLALLAPQTLWAQTNGDACGTHGLTTGGSVIGTSGGVYTKYVCNGSNIYEVERWTTGARTNFNIGLDATASLGAACTQTGRLSYNSADANTPWLYCDGSVWNEFAVIPNSSNITCWGDDLAKELLLEFSPYKFKRLFPTLQHSICGLIANDKGVCYPPRVPLPSTVGSKYIQEENGDYGCYINAAGNINCYDINGALNSSDFGSECLGCTRTPPAGSGFKKLDIAVFNSGTPTNGYACAISSTNSVSCWGAHANIAGSTPPVVTNAIDVAVAQYTGGNSGGCMITGTTSGPVTCWGSRLTALPGYTDYVKIVSNTWQSLCGLRAGGSVVCSGYGYTPTVTDAIDIAFSQRAQSTFCALRSNGSTVCYGSNATIIANAPTTPSSATQIVGSEKVFCIK